MIEYAAEREVRSGQLITSRSRAQTQKGDLRETAQRLIHMSHYVSFAHPVLVGSHLLISHHFHLSRSQRETNTHTAVFFLFSLFTLRCLIHTEIFNNASVFI